MKALLCLSTAPVMSTLYVMGSLSGLVFGVFVGVWFTLTLAYIGELINAARAERDET